eukprot:GHVR01042566.1.p1 GENE.GHVR01042566.1~~GHVR01042566.1.p1  ORF type:complete len:360 (+),score=101.28 GHVR01042566.1:56-1135(+)
MEGEKLKRAAKHMKDGDKHLKSSILSFRFTPDYTTAALEYNEAAQIYAAAGKIHEAVRAYIATSSAREKEPDLFLAGKSLESAALVLSRETSTQEEHDRIIELQRMAVSYYQRCSKNDCANKLLLKIANNIKESDYTAADDIYRDCIISYEYDEQYHYASDVYRDRINLLAKNKSFSKLKDVCIGHVNCLIKLKQVHLAHRMSLGVVVACLAEDEPIAAENSISNAVSKDSSFLKSKEYFSASEAVSYYKEGDSVSLRKCLTSSSFSSLPNELSRLARDIYITPIIGVQKKDAHKKDGQNNNNKNNESESEESISSPREVEHHNESVDISVDMDKFMSSSGGDDTNTFQSSVVVQEGGG